MILECSNLECHLRFPITSTSKIPRFCPRCKHPVVRINSYSDSPLEDSAISSPNIFRFSVLLDNIRSAYNVGSIIRSADGFNIRHVYLCGITPTPENPKVNKTSLGAEKTVSWSYSPNSLLTVRRLITEGFILYGLETGKESRPIHDIELAQDQENEHIVLILGNEVTGIDPEIRSLCNQLLYIPMMGKKQSFNVTIAFGIAAFYLLQKINK